MRGTMEHTFVVNGPLIPQNVEVLFQHPPRRVVAELRHENILHGLAVLANGRERRSHLTGQHLAKLNAPLRH